MTDSFTRTQAVAKSPDVDFDTMDPSELLKHLLADQGEKAALKAELREAQQDTYKHTTAARLDTGLPPEGEEDLHPNHWLIVHRGVTQQTVSDYTFVVSNIYSGLLAIDADGKYYNYTIAAGLQWIPTWAFSGAFERPDEKLLAQAVEAGLLEVIPPGIALDVRTLGHELKDKLAIGAMQLCRDARTMRFFAELAGGVNKGAMLRKADELEQSQPKRVQPKTVAEFAAVASK